MKWQNWLKDKYASWRLGARFCQKLKDYGQIKEINYIIQAFLNFLSYFKFMEKEHKVSIEARTTYLPSDGPANAVVIPTFDRWGDKDRPGFLPRSIKSITGAIE